MKFYLVYIISLNYDTCFLELPWDIVYGVISGTVYICLAFRKRKKAVKYLNLF